MGSSVRITAVLLRGSRGLDRTVSQSLGRHSPSDPLLLIGTQTLEQSLDIDADLFITDLAPADVPLQRVDVCIVTTVSDRRLRTGLLSGTRSRRDLEAALMPGETYQDATWRSVTAVCTMIHVELTRRILTEHPQVSIRMIIVAWWKRSPSGMPFLSYGERWACHGQAIEGGELAQAIAAAHAAAVYDRFFGDPTLQFNEMGGK